MKHIQQNIVDLLNNFFEITNIKYDDLNSKYFFTDQEKEKILDFEKKYPELTLGFDKYDKISLSSFGLLNTIMRLVFNKPLYLKIDLNGYIKGVEFLDEEDKNNRNIK